MNCRASALRSLNIQHSKSARLQKATRMTSRQNLDVITDVKGIRDVLKEIKGIQVHVKKNDLKPRDA